MATVKIPTTSNPFRVIVNGVEYIYAAGTTVEVPDAVATVIEQHIDAAEDMAAAPELPQGGTALGGADWNAKEGQPGHVLNRTHWVEISESAVLVPDTAISFTDGPQLVLTEPVVKLVEGKEYTVTWNSVEYKCTAQEFSMDGMTTPVLGNGGAVTGGTDSGEPFAIVCLTEELAAQAGVSIVIFALAEVSAVTFSIVGYGEIVHKLNKKFLPDMGSSGNAAMLVDFEITDSGLSLSKDYAVIRAHVESGGTAFIRFTHNYDNVETTNLYPLFQMTDTELDFRCLIISSLSLYVQTITIDNTNAATLASHIINVDSVD